MVSQAKVRDLSTTDVLALMLGGWALRRDHQGEWLEHRHLVEVLPLGTIDKMLALSFIEREGTVYRVTGLGEYRVTQAVGVDHRIYERKPVPAEPVEPADQLEPWIDEFSVWVLSLSFLGCVVCVLACWLFKR